MSLRRGIAGGWNRPPDLILYLRYSKLILTEIFTLRPLRILNLDFRERVRNFKLTIVNFDLKNNKMYYVFNSTAVFGCTASNSMFPQQKRFHCGCRHSPTYKFKKCKCAALPLQQHLATISQLVLTRALKIPIVFLMTRWLVHYKPRIELYVVYFNKIVLCILNTGYIRVHKLLGLH